MEAMTPRQFMDVLENHWRKNREDPMSRAEYLTEKPPKRDAFEIVREKLREHELALKQNATVAALFITRNALLKSIHDLVRGRNPVP